MNTTTEELNDIVRGPWEKGAHFYECHVNTGNPEYLMLQYDVQEDRRNVDVHQYRAQVNANGPDFEVKLYSHAETAREAVEALIEEWGDEIEQFVGTIHPASLGGGRACLDLRPVDTNKLTPDFNPRGKGKESRAFFLPRQFDSPWCALIVENRDGRIFTSQTGGVMCNHPTAKGLLVDLGGENMPRKDPKGAYEEAAKRVIESIPNPALRKMLEPREYGTAEEAWVNLRIPEDAEGASDWMRGQDVVLAYPNSD